MYKLYLVRLLVLNNYNISFTNYKGIQEEKSEIIIFKFIAANKGFKSGPKCERIATMSSSVCLSTSYPVVTIISYNSLLY